jgi:hypothetical protein
VNEIQAACDTAVQLHSRAVPMVRVPDPPEGPNDEGAPVTDVSHLVPDGLVTLFTVVLAELPQAAEESTTAIAAAHDRDRIRRGTRGGMQEGRQPGPYMIGSLAAVFRWCSPLSCAAAAADWFFSSLYGPS